MEYTILNDVKMDLFNNLISNDNVYNLLPLNMFLNVSICIRLLPNMRLQLMSATGVSEEMYNKMACSGDFSCRH